MSEHEYNQTVSIKSMTDDTVTVVGWGVIYGGKDLVGETFTADTDFMLDLVPEKPVLYDHGMNGRVSTSFIGKAKAIPEDVGIWVEAELDRHNEYMEYVLPLVEKGALGWSSGTVAHLSKREGTVIKSWPIVEFSLTPTPAEPRTLGVERIKALAEAAPQLKDILSQIPSDESEPTGEPQALGDSAASEGEAKSTEMETSPIEKNTENSDMSDELKALQGQVAALETSIKDLVQKLPATNGGDVQVVGDEADRALKGNPFKSLGEQLIAVQQHDSGVKTDPRILALKQLGLNEGIPSEGGVLVQQDLQPGLIKRAYDLAVLAGRVNRFPVSANANGIRLNAVAETSRVRGSRWGGVRAYWLGEAGTKTPSMPEFRQMQLDLKKLIGLCYATDELLQDSSALESIITQAFGEEFAYEIDDAIYRGSGAGRPVGMLGHASAVNVARSVAGAINHEDIVAMWSRMWGRSRANAIWVYNQDCEPSLYTMGLAVGVGGVPSFMPPGGLSGAPYATLMGRPAIPLEQASSLGELGDIALIDPSQYVAIDKGGIQTASSIHVQFLTDQTAFRFVYRFDGQPGWSAPLTPASGSANTLSPFVFLAA